MAGELDQGLPETAGLSWGHDEVAVPAVGVSLELSDISVVDRDPAGFGKPEVFTIGANGIQDAGEIPGGSVVGHLQVANVGLSERVAGHVAKFLLNCAGGKEHCLTDFKATEDHG